MNDACCCASLCRRSQCAAGPEAEMAPVAVWIHLNFGMIFRCGGWMRSIYCLVLVWVAAIVGCSGDKLDCADGTHEEDDSCVSDDAGGTDTGMDPDEDTGEDGDTGGPPPVTYSSLDEVLEPLRAEWGLPSLGAGIVSGTQAPGPSSSWSSVSRIGRRSGCRSRATGPRSRRSRIQTTGRLCCRQLR